MIKRKLGKLQYVKTLKKSISKFHFPVIHYTRFEKRLSFKILNYKKIYKFELLYFFKRCIFFQCKKILLKIGNSISKYTINIQKFHF